MRDAVLGDDVVHVVFTRGADRAGRKARADLAYRALGGRCKGDEALAALRLASAADVVDLTAGAGHMLRADRLGADLTEEVDLDGGVYGYHIVILTDDRRVVDVVDGQDGDGGVIVDIVVYPLRAVGEGRDGLAAVYLLAAVVKRIINMLDF